MAKDCHRSPPLSSLVPTTGFFAGDDTDEASSYKTHAPSETAGVVIEVPSSLPKRHVIALKKKDLANPNKKSTSNPHQDCITINAHSKTSVHKVCISAWVRRHRWLESAPGYRCSSLKSSFVLRLLGSVFVRQHCWVVLRASPRASLILSSTGAAARNHVRSDFHRQLSPGFSQNRRLGSSFARRCCWVCRGLVRIGAWVRRQETTFVC
nr:hypothetical protein CFP56_68407 [Quercus suber]